MPISLAEIAFFFSGLGEKAVLLLAASIRAR
jgi:hypothetical protein